MGSIICNAALYNQRSSGSWDAGQARQGKYSTTLHRGLLVFPDLGNGFMQDKRITDLSLQVVSDAAGNNASKSIFFYSTSKTGSGGSATNWMGAYLALVTGTFYKNTQNFMNLKTSYNAFYEIMKEYLEGGGKAFGLYINENVQSGKSWSRNYLKLTAFRLLIEYEQTNLYVRNGSEWSAQIPYYHNGTEFVRCEAYRHDGTGWKK